MSIDQLLPLWHTPLTSSLIKSSAKSAYALPGLRPTRDLAR
jgi:hypothetical protein